MLADYSSDPTLYDHCLRLIDSCFPGIKPLADRGRSHNAYWDKSSIPFIIKQEGVIAAHLGLLPFEVLVEGSSYHAAAVHGICTQEAHRRKGYFRQLMIEALDYIEHHYDLSFLFTDQPELYEQFGFKITDEYDFIYEISAPSKQANLLRNIDLDDPNDLALMQDLYLNRLPLSKRFSIVREAVVSTLNALHEPVYYIKNLNTLVVYQIMENTLLLKDIVFTQQPDLKIILQAIPENFSKIILQFCPDIFIGSFKPIKATPECCIMIAKDFDIGSALFRYPEPQRC
ncbi:MAG: GNAT family N-acetyltransferase [Candidatus Berkiellales bacterium]